jgi:hypothetical protein
MTQSNRGLRKRLDPERRVQEGTVSLRGGPSYKSVEATVPIDAVRHAGRDADAPGECSWFYLPDLQLLAFDLGGQFDGGELDR